MTLLQTIETNDCTVRSIADAYDISYENAHKLCARFGRKQGEGFHIRAELIHKLGLKLLERYINMTVREMLDWIEKDKVYICLVNGHMFTIKQKFPVESHWFHEWHKTFDRKKVVRLYEVKPLVIKESKE